MGYRRSAHATYDLKFHLVWITKYRKPVLRGAVGLRLRELIRQVCATLDVEIIKGHVAVDHVHLLVSVPPEVAVSQLMQRLKGRSSRKILDEFEAMGKQFWGRHLWARGYFAVSSGNVTDTVIARYIELQGEMPPDDDDNFRVAEL